MLYTGDSLKEFTHLFKKLTVSFNHGNVSLPSVSIWDGSEGSHHVNFRLITLFGNTCDLGDICSLCELVQTWGFKVWSFIQLRFKYVFNWQL